MDALRPLNIFISYARKDEKEKELLLGHLRSIQRQGLIAPWDDSQILPAEEWGAVIEGRLDQADIVILLISSNFLSSEYCMERELKRAMERYEERTVKIVPVFIHPCDWTDEPFAIFQGVPRNGEPISTKYKGNLNEGYKEAAVFIKEFVIAWRAGQGNADSAVSACSDGLNETRGRAAWLFVGREPQLADMRDRLLGDGAEPRIVALKGMPGVGKSYLADRFFEQHRTSFRSYQHIVLEPSEPAEAAHLLDSLARKFDIQGGAEPLRRYLLSEHMLVHIENVDSRAAGKVASYLVRALHEVPIVVSGRLSELSFSQGALQIQVDTLEDEDATALLKEELRHRVPEPQAPSHTDALALVRAVGGLPLAISTAAGYIAGGGISTDIYLSLLKNEQLRLENIDPTDQSDDDGQDQSNVQQRRVLATTFQLSLDLLREEVDEPSYLAFLAMGQAPTAGFGRILGAAVAGLDETQFSSMAVKARNLSLLMPCVEGQADRWRLHPLVAEHLRNLLDNDPKPRQRLQDWYLNQALDGTDLDERRERWTCLDAERAGLIEWLAEAKPDSNALNRISSACQKYVESRDPWIPWADFIERHLDGVSDPGIRSDLLWTLSGLKLRSGDPEGAIDLAHTQRKLYEEHGDKKEAALAAGCIADIHQARGDLQQALFIRRNETLPVYERLGDKLNETRAKRKIAAIYFTEGRLEKAFQILQETLSVFEHAENHHESAIAYGQIADIFFVQGKLIEALNYRTNYILPAVKRLGDVREYALTMGRIADIHHARGDTDEALRIHEETLPVLERWGYLRERALTKRKIASLYFARGDLDKAHKILIKEVLPIFERIGDDRQRAITFGKIAEFYKVHGDLKEALRIRESKILPVFKRLGDVREESVTWSKIADIFQDSGQFDDATRIREQQLEVFKRLGDVRWTAITLSKIADIHQASDRLDEAMQIHRNLRNEFRRLGDKRWRAITQGKIANILQAHGQLDKALRIRKRLVLPIYNRLEDTYELMRGRTQQALCLLQRGQPGDRDEAKQLICQAWEMARRMEIPVGALRETIDRYKLDCS